MINISPEETFTVCLPKQKRERIQFLAQQQKKPSSFIVEKTIDNFLEEYEWQKEGLENAKKSLQKGKRYEGKSIMNWIYSVGTKDELPRPSLISSL